MSKFTEWLKFYFLGFYTHGLSKEGGDRSFFNTLLSFVLAFVILCAGLIAGYTASFGVHYKGAETFKNFLYSAFACEGDERIGLSVKDGYLSAEIKNGERVNTILGEGEIYAKDGYQMIVDTRPASTTYAEFTVKCKGKDGSEIDYSAYRTLSADDKKQYSLSMEYSGKRLDPAVKLQTYEEHLDGVSVPDAEGYAETTATAYNKLKTDLAEQTITREDYINGVYGLYCNSYYSGLVKDANGNAPTLRSYYLASTTYANTDKYIAVLDNVCFCAFKTDGGLSVEFSGYFNTLDNGEINGDGMTAEQMRAGVDRLVNKSFSSASALNFLVYIISLSRSVVLFVMAIILIALLIFLALKLKKVEDCPRYTDAIKIAGSFILWSAILTFVVTLILSFFVPRGAVFTCAEIMFAVIIAVRAIVYAVIEIIADKKKKASQPQQSEEI